MKEEQEPEGVPNISELCGDGSCGCGCGLPMDTSRVSSEEKIQGDRSRAVKAALDVREDRPDTRPVEK